MTPPQFERLKGEKAEQWQAFKTYRDMGSTRSMQELARIMKRPVRNVIQIRPGRVESISGTGKNFSGTSAIPVTPLGLTDSFL